MYTHFILIYIDINQILTELSEAIRLTVRSLIVVTALLMPSIQRPGNTL